MATDRMQRRHVREKHVIDHLAENVFEPSAPDGAAVQDSKTETGLSVEKQVRETWDPKKGGLPIFHPTRR